MEIQILHLLSDVNKAKGITVIIDVFRAFSVECYLYNNELAQLLMCEDTKDAFSLKELDPSYILIGERGGKIVDGFNYGNSPSQIKEHDFTNCKVIHSTSAGTKGVVNAMKNPNVEEVITASLNNSKAISKYLKAKNPKYVSLVCMGLEGITQTEEDNLCARYIKDLILNNDTSYINGEIEKLKETSGKKFFDKLTQEIFPEPDFFDSTKLNIFDFVLRVKPSHFDKMYQVEKVLIK